MNTDKDITELIDCFLADQDVSSQSRKQYDVIICIFFTWIENSSKDWKNLKRSDIIQYKEKLYKENKSELTIANYVIVIRKFFSWCKLNSFYQNIAEGIKTPKKYRGFKKLPLSIQQVKKLISVIPKDTLIGKRDLAIINLMLRSGIREIEVVRINIKDISELYNNRVIFVQRKGKITKEEPIALTDKTWDKIHSYLIIRRDWQEHHPLFISHNNHQSNGRLSSRTISKLVKYYLRLAGIDDPKITAHSLRHTAGTIALEQGASEYQTQMLLGHANFATTQIYTRAMEMKMKMKNNAGLLLDKCF